MLDIRDEMRKVGIGCDERIEVDGELHRFDNAMDPEAKRGKKNGWYVFYSAGDRVSGAYGDWRYGATHTYSAGESHPLVQEQKRAARRARADEADEAARRALVEWGFLESVGDSEYLKRKGIPALGVRFGRASGGENFTAVPMTRGWGIVGLQKIYDSGGKRFTAGCSKKGAYFIIPGEVSTVLCEGYATGASIHMATGFSVLVCFDCGNMVEVAKALSRGSVEGVTGPCLIATDEDSSKVNGVLRNPGREAAEAASRVLGCGIVSPLGGDNFTGTDFNDLHKQFGLAAVAVKFLEEL